MSEGVLPLSPELSTVSEVLLTGLTQNQNLRGHHADPFFPDAAIVQ